MYSSDYLRANLAGYCNWSSLPPTTLAAAASAWEERSGAKPSIKGSDENGHEAFLHILATSVPLEWTLTQHTVAKQHAAMHAQAVATHSGDLWCFGGMQLGQLTELKMKSEISWLQDFNPAQLAPDMSRVYQVTAVLSSSTAAQPVPCLR
jgi:hypothetical protein